MELYSAASRRFQPAVHDSNGMAVVIIVPIVSVVAVVCVILFLVWRWLRSKLDERRKNEGEELRLRMHREGYIRAEPEAVSMAEVVLRPLTRWPCPNRWEGLSSSGMSDTLASPLDLEEGLLMPRSSAVVTDDGLSSDNSSFSHVSGALLLCPLCHDPLTHDVAITRLLCGHMFHHSCVRAVVRRMLTHYEPLVCPLQNCQARILESAEDARVRDEVRGREQRAEAEADHSFTPQSFMGEGVPIVSLQSLAHTDNGDRENTCTDPPTRSASLRQDTVRRTKVSNSSFGSANDLLSSSGSSRSNSSSSLTSNSNSNREIPARRTSDRLSTRKPSGMANRRRVEEAPLSSGLPLTPRSVLKKTSSYPLRKSHRSIDRGPR